MIDFFSVTLTLNLDRVIWHTVVHHSSTSTYILNFFWMDEHTDVRTFERHTDIIRSTLRSRPKKLFEGSHYDKNFKTIKGWNHSQQ